MKKIIVFLFLILICGCAVPTNDVSVDTTSIEDFYSKEYLEEYYNHKNELPVKLDYQESYMLYENIDNQEIIKEVYNALIGIKIGAKTNIDINDAERNYWFTYSDGSEIGFMLIKADKDMLIYNPKDKYNYVIEDDNGLFSIDISDHN